MHFSTLRSLRLSIILGSFFCVLLLASGRTSLSQQKSANAGPGRLPSADRVVGDYLKVLGGKKRVSAIRDATYEWTSQQQAGGTAGEARTELSSPSSLRMTIRVDKSERQTGVSPSSVWQKSDDGTVQTITGKTAADSRLRALLLATHFVNYSKYNVLARVTGVEPAAGSPQFIVEFSMRNGARVRAWFDASSKLLMKIEDGSSLDSIVFGEYKVENGIQEPHRTEIESKDSGRVILTLQRVTRNTGLTAATFDPPAPERPIDLTALIHDLQVNQGQIDERVSDYYYTQKETQRDINDKGELKKETVKVYEVFPVPGRQSVLKLVSENGVSLSPERAEKEQKRVGEELEKAERDRAKDKEKRERRAQEKDDPKKDDDRGPNISTFLRACDLVSPRTEMLGNRRVEVLDFRPKPGFRPATREESIVSKLIGIVWIDPIDKVVMRLEARFAEGFKVGGGLVLSLKPGAAFVLEQTRLDDGVWLPKFAQANLSYKLFLLGGGNVNATYEWSDYHRIKTEAKDYKLDAPTEAKPDEAKPGGPAEDSKPNPKP